MTNTWAIGRWVSYYRVLGLAERHPIPRRPAAQPIVRRQLSSPKRHPAWRFHFVTMRSARPRRAIRRFLRDVTIEDSRLKCLTVRPANAL
jgi:hypothetical protein